MALTVGLAGCGAPLPLFYKEGETVNRLDAALTQCRAESLKTVPVNEKRRFVRANFFNRDDDDIRPFTGNIIHRGRFETFDANKDRREKVTAQCMQAKGFSFETLPACTFAVASAATDQATVVLPPLTTESCAIRNRDGGFQVVTP